MIVTQSQAGRLKRRQPEQTKEENSKASSDSGEVAEKSASTISSDREVLEASVNTESRTEAEEGESDLGLALPVIFRESSCTLPEVLSSKFNFGDDMFVDGEKDKGLKKSRSKKRRRHYEHARVQRAGDGDLNFKEELQKLQDEDLMI